MSDSVLDRPIKLNAGRLKAAKRLVGDMGPLREEARVSQADATFVLAGEAARIDVPVELVPVILEMLEQLMAGDAVTIAPVHAELTTQQAADLLNVSRPHLVKLIDTQRLAAKKVGTHRRVRLDDLLRYRDADDARRRAAADELARELVELGLDY